MIRLTIKTVNSRGAIEFPMRSHVLRFQSQYSMKENEVEEEIKKFREKHPDRHVVEWKKDIIRGEQDEAMEMVNAERESQGESDSFNEPIC